MGYNLVNDLLVFNDASLALYEAFVPGAHRFRLRCSEGDLPTGWLLPSLDSLICEELIPEDFNASAPDGFTMFSVYGGKALIAHETLLSACSFEYEDQALAALLSLGGLVILLSDETHAGLPIQENALAFRGGAPIRGGGCRSFSNAKQDHWGWSCESGVEAPPKNPIADTLAPLLPAFKGAFLFDDYLPRNTDRRIWNPSDQMVLPDISQLLEEWSAWQKS